MYACVCMHIGFLYSDLPQGVALSWESPCLRWFRRSSDPAVAVAAGGVFLVPRQKKRGKKEARKWLLRHTNLKKEVTQNERIQ